MKIELDSLRANQATVVALGQVNQSLSRLGDLMSAGFATIDKRLQESAEILENISTMIASPRAVEAAERRNRGLRAIANGWWDEARVELDAAVQSDPFDWVSWLGGAVVSVALSDATGVANRGTKAIRFASEAPDNDAQCTIAVARMLIAIGRSDDADSVLVEGRNRLSRSDQWLRVTLELSQARKDPSMISDLYRSHPVLMVESANYGYPFLDEAAALASPPWEELSDIYSGSAADVARLLKADPMLSLTPPSDTAFEWCRTCGSYRLAYVCAQEAGQPLRHRNIGCLCASESGLTSDRRRLAVDTLVEAATSLDRAEPRTAVRLASLYMWAKALRTHYPAGIGYLRAQVDALTEPLPAPEANDKPQPRSRNFRFGRQREQDSGHDHVALNEARFRFVQTVLSFNNVTSWAEEAFATLSRLPPWPPLSELWMASRF